jgi:hypothetical protein
MELFDRAAEHRAPRSTCELALQSGFLSMVRIKGAELQGTGDKNVIAGKIRAQSNDTFPKSLNRREIR